MCSLKCSLALARPRYSPNTLTVRPCRHLSQGAVGMLVGVRFRCTFMPPGQAACGGSRPVPSREGCIACRLAVPGQVLHKTEDGTQAWGHPSPAMAEPEVYLLLLLSMYTVLCKQTQSSDNSNQITIVFNCVSFCLWSRLRQASEILSSFDVGLREYAVNQLTKVRSLPSHRAPLPPLWAC